MYDWNLGRFRYFLQSVLRKYFAYTISNIVFGRLASINFFQGLQKFKKSGQKKFAIIVLGLFNHI